MSATVYDDRRCELGEGAFWHPERGQLFWFDITQRRLLSRTIDGPLAWDLPWMASAAGWVDRDTLLVASEVGLHRFDIGSGRHEPVAPLDASNPMTRSNDGRADPWGGFWIGTMGKQAEARAGAIWRYHGGEVRRVVPTLTIPNAICFSPDGLHAYYADTPARQVMRLRLGTQGWPVGEAEVFLDLRADRLSPDGAVTDAEGNFWSAQWGAGRVARYRPDGRFDGAFSLPAAHASCPAFGGEDLSTLFCTTAMEGIDEARRKAEPGHGQVFAVPGAGIGRREPRVSL